MTPLVTESDGFRLKTTLISSLNACVTHPLVACPPPKVKRGQFPWKPPMEGRVFFLPRLSCESSALSLFPTAEIQWGKKHVFTVCFLFSLYLQCESSSTVSVCLNVSPSSATLDQASPMKGVALRNHSVFGSFAGSCESIRLTRSLIPLHSMTHLTQNLLDQQAELIWLRKKHKLQKASKYRLHVDDKRAPVKSRPCILISCCSERISPSSYHYFRQHLARDWH